MTPAERKARGIPWSISGFGVTWLGYGPYFALTFLLGLPAYALLPWVRDWIVTAGLDGAPPAAIDGGA